MIVASAKLVPGFRPHFCAMSHFKNQQLRIDGN
jgi:hypothetical protein